ncbi:MAG: DUF4419 domain-containing protein [Bacteroidales bacterium]|nr:DUF4419 domain-containing protein [Bacteroidales bacterium]
MRKTLVLLCSLIVLTACENRTTGSVETSSEGTQSVVINVESLKRPKGTLKEKDYDAVLKNILKEIGHEEQRIVAHNKEQRKLVPLPHPFFDGMHQAYADHRPFVLSPDAVWLLICQGFAHHVNLYAEELRPMFVNFDGKRMLTVYSDGIDINNPENPWDDYFQHFTEQIASYVGDSLVETLTCDFTTTTPVTRTASQVAIMATTKEFFEYQIYEICGIPQVILEGTGADWQRIIDGVQFLRRYDLAWWVDEMLPVLRKIKLAAEGETDAEFWKGMYKQHDAEHEMCGDPNIIADGWVLKFYPYNKFDPNDEDLKDVPKEAFRNDFQELIDGSDWLPMEIVTAPLLFVEVDGTKHNLDLCAGFVGLSQDHKTLALRPEIGWFITRI